MEVVVGGGGVVLVVVLDEVLDEEEELVLVEDGVDVVVVVVVRGVWEVVVGTGSGACVVVVIGGGASVGPSVCGRYLTLPGGGSFLTGSPSRAPIMKSVHMRAGTVPPVISPYPPRFTSWFLSTSRPSPLYMPTAVASCPGVKPSNQAA